MGVIQEIKKLEKLCKGDVRWGIEGKEAIELLCLIIRDKIKYEQLFEIMNSVCQHVPNSIILQIAEICDVELNDIEYEWEVEGFNDWYQKTYGKTVEEVSG